MSSTHQPLWRKVQQRNFTKWKEFAQFIQLELPLVPTHFPLNVPLRLAEKIVKGEINDPILRQFLPTLDEHKKSPLFVSDPVGDTAAQKAPKLLHKYQGRALLLATSACAMHCRYCFRQHFNYETTQPAFAEELKAIREDVSLKEIILSGGDPLSLSHGQLKGLIDELSTIPHLKRLRFHTRFPIGIPERIDAEFLELLKSTSLQVIFIIHSNHPAEWDEAIVQALKQVQQCGIPVLCQTVLLKGINDDLQTLQTLFEFLSDHGILPYYLHQLDRVEGALHFEVAEEKGQELMRTLEHTLSGYAVPRYVKEIAGEKSKTAII